MAQLKQNLKAFVRCAKTQAAMLAFLASLIAPGALADNPTVHDDPSDDARILRTDEAQGTPFDVQSHRLPDILETRLGAFQPHYPAYNLFWGSWSMSGGFMRLDIVFDGLINPPGLIGLGNNSQYSPYMYGPHPVLGFIELDVDCNEDTGGELNFPDLRYLGNVARLGGLPQQLYYANRVAVSRADFDDPLDSLSPVKRSGEEFHLSLMGEEIISIAKYDESDCGDLETFEAGETWHLTGQWLHRAHGFEGGLAIQCFVTDGSYMPVSKLQFRHNECSNTTTVSLVFPLRNVAFAAMQSSPPPPAQPNNGCPGDQFSIEEALVDLRFSAENGEPSQMSQPEFQLIADWAFETPSAMLNPGIWRLNACLGSAYPEVQAGSARFVWSDMYPNVVNRDFTRDGEVTIADVSALQHFVAEHDGNSLIDEDGSHTNSSIDLCNFSSNFCLYDTDYDGIVDHSDAVLLGDMDWNGIVESDDTDDFAVGMLDPAAYIDQHPGKLPEVHGDMDGNGVLDGRDIRLFVQCLTN